MDNDCKTVFQDIKLGRKYRYVLFGFTKEDVTQIVVLKKADPSNYYSYADHCSSNRCFFVLVLGLSRVDEKYYNYRHQGGYTFIGIS